MKAVIWMSGALASFCLMAIGARELSGELAVFQTLFFRSVIGLICIALILVFSKQKNFIRTKKLRLHTFRNVFHFAGQYGWFVGLGFLPLAEVFALEFTVPIWTIILAALFLGEKITIQKLVSIFLGMLGVFVIVKPGYAIVDMASLIVLGAAVCYAIAHTSTKSLASSEKPLSILFYMCLIQLPIGLILSIPVWVAPAGIQWLWLAIIGLTALSAHFCLVKAMQFTDVTNVVTLDFLRLPLIALLGVLLYSEKFELTLLFGGVLMLLGNLINVKQLSQPPISRKSAKAIE